ncbi:MAG: DNA polymerase Y family protein [Cyanobacteria bacterium SZAS TMP-1]|nr:DNA polymerase Y family protein [Cyanobacteria bacterium SZAS TMP-1]
MYRIACLRIPRFQIAVHQKIEPELRGKPLVLLASRADKTPSLSRSSLNISRAKIVLCSPEATRENVQIGMTFTEARANCSQLIWREYDDRLYQDAQKKLARTLIAASPRVSSAETGIFIFDAQGFNQLGGENKLCRDVLKLASRNGFTDGSVGLADSAFAARVASAHKSQRWYIVPKGSDAIFLRLLSIDFLPVSSQAKESLRELGIKTMGEFVALKKSTYAERFDQDVLNAYDLARGYDRAKPFLPLTEKSYQCLIDVGSSMDSLKETLFILKNMLDRLTTQLKHDGLTAEELLVTFFNDDEKFDERTIKLIRPSNSSKFLLDVVRLSLESKPLIREFTAIHLAVSRHCLEVFEQTRAACVEGASRSFLSLDAGSDISQSESTMLLLQRFITRLGEEALVVPCPNDQYLPENSGIWVPVVQKTTTPLTPVNYAYTHPYLSASRQPRKDDPMPGLVLKRHTPAMPVFVEFDQTKPTPLDQEDFSTARAPDPAPASITYKGQWYHINRITSPERISGMWWEKPVRKSYYMALIEKKRDFAFLNAGRGEVDKQKANIRSLLPPLMTVLLVFDHEESGWFVEGVFD